VVGIDLIGRIDTLVEAGLDGDRILVPEVGEPVEIAGARITALPSSHTELERDPERGYPYLGYVIEWNGVTVYHAGDTVVYDGLIEALSGWNIDIAFVPINGRDYFRTERHRRKHRPPRDRRAHRDAEYRSDRANALRPDRRQHRRFRTLRQPPLRPQPDASAKATQPGELLYFVKVPDD
jgi:L-ascorbate metabolism protein UlaG (beta-lactamase superfamily)